MFKTDFSVKVLKSEMLNDSIKDIFGSLKTVKLAEVKIGRPINFNGELGIVTNKGNGKIVITINGINTYIPFEESIKTFVMTPDI